MNTVKFNTQNFSINSSWECESVPYRPGIIPTSVPSSAISARKYQFKSGTPTWGSRVVNFQFSIPSGAVVSKARIYANCSNVLTGYSVLSVNGNALKRLSNGVYYADVVLGSVGGTFKATFGFKANGNMVDTATHTATMTFRDVYLQIDYESPATAPQQKKQDNEVMTVPPQSVCIYDNSTGKTYLFDGVLKIQHQLTMKIEEEPSKKKDEYVNNARNEPDKVTIEVVMSDVYSGGGAFSNSAGLSNEQSAARNATKNSVSIEDSRSANAFAVLHALKEARQKLAVITPQFVYVNMIIASVTTNQDDSCPYGWMGQIVFQRAYEQKKKQENNSGAKTGGDLVPEKSMFETIKEWLGGKT